MSEETVMSIARKRSLAQRLVGHFLMGAGLGMVLTAWIAIVPNQPIAEMIASSSAPLVLSSIFDRF
jgi:hypothetical protein